MIVFLDRLAHAWRIIRANGAMFRFARTAHGHGHQIDVTVCGSCLAEIPVWARIRVYDQEHAR